MGCPEGSGSPLPARGSREQSGSDTHHGRHCRQSGAIRGSEAGRSEDSGQGDDTQDQGGSRPSEEEESYRPGAEGLRRKSRVGSGGPWTEAAKLLQTDTPQHTQGDGCPQSTCPFIVTRAPPATGAQTTSNPTPPARFTVPGLLRFLPSHPAKAGPARVVPNLGGHRAL